MIYLLIFLNLRLSFVNLRFIDSYIKFDLHGVVMNNTFKKIHTSLNDSLQLNNIYQSCNQSYKIADLFTYQHYSPKYKLFFNKESVGFVLETPPITMSSEKMNTAINKLFKDLLPQDSRLQVMLFADPCIEGCLSRWKELRANSILQSIAQKTFPYLKKYAFKSQDLPYVLRDFRCIISFSIKSNNNSIDLENINQLKNQLQTRLEQLGLQVLCWEAKELISILNNIVNLDPTDDEQLNYHKQSIQNWNELQHINHQITDIDNQLEVCDTELKLNAGKIAIRTYQTAPIVGFWSLQSIGLMIGNEEDNSDFSQIPCPFIIHYELRMNKQRTQQPTTLSQEDQQEGLGVILLAPQEQLNVAEQILLNLSVSKKLQLQKNTFGHLPAFLCSMPMIN